MSNTKPPLGNLRGMYYDAVRQRYFPLTAEMTNQGFGNGKEPVCARKRKEVEVEPPQWDVSDSRSARRRTARSLGPRRDHVNRRRAEDRIGSTTLHGIAGLCDCHGRKITSVKSFGPGGLAVTTDKGQVIIGCPDGDAFSFTACTDTLLGVHCNVARGTWIAVANGKGPHIHTWRRDPLNLVHVPPEQWTIDLPAKDIYAMSSFDNITTLVTEDNLLPKSRRLPSDPMRLHHTSTDLVWAGMRSGAILLDDLRTPQGRASSVGSMPRGRAVTGLKRLNDAAVPYGLIAAGMDHQLVLYDVRFSSKPMRELVGHNNPYQPSLGFATSPDDTVVFVGGFDNRLRAWSTVTGERVFPRNKDKRNALAFEFKHLVEHIDVSPSLTVRTANAGDILRFEHVDNPKEMQRWLGGVEDDGSMS